VNTRTYRRVAQFAGPYRIGHEDLVFPAGDVRFEGQGVYLACRIDGGLDYVGSSRCVRKRISSHTREKRRRWCRIWVVPTAVDRRTLEAIEGEVIKFLDPPGNRRRHRYRAIA